MRSRLVYVRHLRATDTIEVSAFAAAARSIFESIWQKALELTRTGKQFLYF